MSVLREFSFGQRFPRREEKSGKRLTQPLQHVLFVASPRDIRMVVFALSVTEKRKEVRVWSWGSLANFRNRDRFCL
ncbi:MAG: hypothetical protein ACYCX4_03870 [Bacillota bacterium]